MKASQPAVDDSSSGLDHRRFLTVATASGFAMGRYDNALAQMQYLVDLPALAATGETDTAIHPLVQIAPGTAQVTVTILDFGRGVRSACQ
jgi:hypothetical protein